MYSPIARKLLHNVYFARYIYCTQISKYRIYSYSFRGNYSFLNLEIQRSQYIRTMVSVDKCAETIQGRKLFKGGNYMRKYGMYYINFVVCNFRILINYKIHT